MTTAALRLPTSGSQTVGARTTKSRAHTSTTAGDCLIRNHITWYTADIITHSLWQCYL